MCGFKADSSCTILPALAGWRHRPVCPQHPEGLLSLRQFWRQHISCVRHVISKVRESLLLLNLKAMLSGLQIQCGKPRKPFPGSWTKHSYLISNSFKIPYHFPSLPLSLHSRTGFWYTAASTSHWIAWLAFTSFFLTPWRKSSYLNTFICG